MVAKNNLKHQLAQTAQRVPHYGLRKLSVGVASVLLSTTLYLGVNAQAATVTPVNPTPNGAGQVSDQPVAGENPDQGSPVASSDQQAVHPQPAPEPDTTHPQPAPVPADPQPAPNPDATLPKPAPVLDPVPVPTDNGVTIPANQDFQTDQALVGTGKSATVALADGVTLTTDNDVVDSDHSSALITFSGSVHAGDTYVIRVPKQGD